MKKVIIIITSIILCLSVGVLCYLYKEYNWYSKSGKDVKVVEKEINKIDYRQ